MAESFCLLLAVGGDCIDDFETLRDDVGLADTVGYELPSPTRAKEYLYAYDEGMELTKSEAAQRPHCLTSAPCTTITDVNASYFWGTTIEANLRFLCGKRANLRLTDSTGKPYGIRA